ncbi:MAG TPA: sulfatase [Terriglobia bacterium]|nr:sulfatase [Terriglobia bacterium]
MKITEKAPVEATRKRLEIFYRFVVITALAGLLLGIFEAALLRTSPYVDFLPIPDIGPVEWYLAPLLDMACFGLWGLLQGWLASRWPRKLTLAILVAIDAAAFVAFVVLRLKWLHTRIVIKRYTFGIDILNEKVWFAAGFVVALLAVYWLWEPASKLASRFSFRVLRYLSWGLGLAGVVALCGIGTFLVNPFSGPARVQAESDARSQSPNIIFIVLDTVRADHLSSYGYSRPTTPNLDRLAREGTLFENAIAPTSWTLASHASMFTGLLPHQHGADWAVPLPPGPRMLAQILRSRGYETAGFVANYDYLQIGWGIGRGFETYVDSRQSLRHNLASTLVGTALIQPLYQRYCRFDFLERLHAAGVDKEVFRWFRRRPQHPYFLFINYFDTHVPYYSDPPYDHRFGKVSGKLVHKLFDALQGADPAKGLSAEDRTTLIAAYDDCLAYLDAQVGRLLDFLHTSPEGRNTIIIITSDHGEAFGEQGYYSHGYNLGRELLHVPLIIAGPGIPKDVRIQHLVRTRDLFSTVLDLAGGGKTPFSRESLARFWNPGFTPQPFDNFVVSELVPVFNEGGKKAMISLTTPEWQYIDNSDGRQELYRWTTDPLDQKDLAGSAGAQATMEGLRNQLIQAVAGSSGPWRNQNYLFAGSNKGKSFLDEILNARKTAQPSLSGNPLYIGAAQSIFASEEPVVPSRPPTPDRDTLQSLPYH